MKLLWKNGHKVVPRKQTYLEKNQITALKPSGWFDTGLVYNLKRRWFKPEYPYGGFSMNVLQTDYPWLRLIRVYAYRRNYNWTVVCFEEDWEKLSKFLGNPSPFKGFSSRAFSKAAVAEDIRVAYVGIRDLESYEKGLERFT